MQDCVYKDMHVDAKKTEDERAERDVLTARVFTELILAAKNHLVVHKKEVDALNVFPVPDGDTGTNMSLTLSSAVDNVRGILGASSSLSLVAEKVSQGALMGARGNSGVILSQILRGISKGFSEKESADARDVANALDQAVAVAYKAVMKPTEGTILTVLRAVRDSVLSSVEKTRDIAAILDKALDDAKIALAKTPEQLPVLKQAGVVDAGGKGLVLILEAFVNQLSGRVPESEIYFLEKGVMERSNVEETGSGFENDKSQVGPEIEGTSAERKMTEANVTVEDILAIENPYDTQFLLHESLVPQDEVRRQLETMGDSVLVVGTKELLRVHIHTKVPGDVLTYCLKCGYLSQVTVDNMVEQSMDVLKRKKKDTVGAGATPDGQEVPQGLAEEAAQKEIAIVSVATGEGLKEIMRSLGCDLVIDGGATMNPSTSDLLNAVKSLRARKIIFIPNNGNIFLAAKQAKNLFGRSMYIVPSRTIPQGISALLSLNLREDMAHNLKRAGKAVKAVKTGEITFAARDGKFGRYVMKKGDVLGLIDGKVEALGQDPEEMLVRIVKTLAQKDDSVVTIYYGQERTEDHVKTCINRLRAEMGPDAEIEFHNGGQPLYYYIISCE